MPKTNIPVEVLRHRERLGLSQTEFARLCGVSQPVISQLELDHHEPRVSTLRKIATALGMELVFGDSKGRVFRKRKK